MYLMQNIQGIIQEVISDRCRFALISGDCKDVLKDFPDNCIDCVITSPPYWHLRDYNVDSEHRPSVIGSEEKPEQYVANLGVIFNEILRVLKPEGSLWLNIGDKYVEKNLLGLPWRVAFALQDYGWILRSDVIWEKMKGSQPVKDRFRDNYEHIFYFVKQYLRQKGS